MKAGVITLMGSRYTIANVRISMLAMCVALGWYVSHQRMDGLAEIKK